MAPTRVDADNSAGSFKLAACNDWHRVSRFHVGTGHIDPTSDAGYTTACVSLCSIPIGQSLVLREEFHICRVSPLLSRLCRHGSDQSSSSTCLQTVRLRFPRNRVRQWSSELHRYHRWRANRHSPHCRKKYSDIRCQNPR